MSKSLVIKLVRHGESDANVGQVDPRDVGDHRIKLTRRGRKQARDVGPRIGKRFIKGALVYRSPYTRTRQTCDLALLGAGIDVEIDGIRILEDPRLREIDFGYKQTAAEQMPMRLKYGWFYYRFEGGQSPADCFDRVSSFLESLMRQVQRKKAKRVVIFAHGLVMRVLVMRFLHLSVEQFETLDNPDNCDVITIAHKSKLENPQFTSGKWGIEGLRFRGRSTPKTKKSNRKSK